MVVAKMAMCGGTPYQQPGLVAGLFHARGRSNANALPPIPNNRIMKTKGGGNVLVDQLELEHVQI